MFVRHHLIQASRLVLRLTLSWLAAIEIVVHGQNAGKRFTNLVEFVGSFAFKVTTNGGALSESS